MLAPLSAMSTMTAFSTTSVAFARDPVIVMDAPQSAHTFDLSSSAEILSTAGLAAGLAMYAFTLGPSSTWCKCAGILMTVLPCSSIVNTSLYHRASISSFPPIYPAPRLNITCSSSTSLRRESIISMDDWKARSPHSAAVPPDSIRAIRKWTIVRCLLHARPRYKRSGKCAVSPKKDSTSLKSS